VLFRSAAVGGLLFWCNDIRAGVNPTPSRESLSPYMNSIPPSKNYFCVGTGPSNRVLHPDRAPYTQLAEQDGVILFSGAAPQQGLNFQLNAGSLIYRNQMSSLGSPEPTPQIGTAGTLTQRPWDFVLPWSEARWHPGRVRYRPRGAGLHEAAAAQGGVTTPSPYQWPAQSRPGDRAVRRSRTGSSFQSWVGIILRLPRQRVVPAGPRQGHLQHNRRATPLARSQDGSLIPNHPWLSLRSPREACSSGPQAAGMGATWRGALGGCWW